MGGAPTTRARSIATGSVVDLEIYGVDVAPDVYLRRGCAGTELDGDAGTDLGAGLFAADLRESVTTGEVYSLFIDGGYGSYVAFHAPL